MRFTPARLACCLLAACGLNAAATAAPPAELPRQCRALVEQALPGWKPAQPSADVAAWARTRNVNPVVATGDFDADGMQDWAGIGRSPAGQALVVCLGPVGTMRLRAFTHEGCGDYIVRHARGAVLRNQDTGKSVRMRRDSIGAGCFEKAGQLISLDKGRFRVFTHMD